MIKRPLLCCIIAFVFGIFLSEFILGIASIAISFVLCEILCYLSKKNRKNNIKSQISHLNLLLFFLCMFLGFIYIYCFNFSRYEEIKLLDNRIVNIKGIVSNEGVNKRTYWEYILKNSVVNGEKMKSNILIKTKEELKYGNKIEMSGVTEIPKKARNQNTFDYAKYLKTLNVYIIAEANTIKIIKEDTLFFVQKISWCIREKVREFTKANLDSENAGILNALIIGDESGIEDNLEDNYKKSGMLHLLVVSGGHTVFLIILLKFMVSYIGISKNVSKIIYILVIFLYIFITGATSSILRAGIGIIIVIIAELIGRQNDSITTVSIVAFVLLVMNPNTLFSLSFLLSFGGVLGIMLCYPKISLWLNKIPKSIAEPLALTISAQLVVTPITIYSFNVIYLGGIISNIFTLNLSGLIMMAGIVLFILYLLIPPFVIFPMKIVSICISIMNKIAEFFSGVSWLIQYVVTPNLFSIVIYYGILLYVFLVGEKEVIQNYRELMLIKYSRVYSRFSNNFRRIIVGCGIISILILNIKLIDFDKSLKVSMIDVGHGDSILITTPNNKYVLIDTGDKYYKGEQQVDSGEQIIVPYLLKQGIKNIDWLILTHMDSDHIGGYESIAKVIKINNLGLSINSGKKEEYKKIREVARNRHININGLKRGQILIVDGIKIKVLYPQKKKEVREENNDSIVLLIEYENKKILFMGDLEKEGEEELLKLEKNLDIDILKVGHHGSVTSSTYEFIKKATPEIALISVGNRFKSIPGEEVLNNLRTVDSEVYRTDKNGEINISIKAGKIYVSTTY